MPGSVQLCTVQGGVTVSLPVFPDGLASAWIESTEWPAEQTEFYPDGAVQIRSLASTGPRRSWDLQRRFTVSELDTFLDFVAARKGITFPFYFYPWTADYDPTGVSETGRYTVRLDSSVSPQWAIRIKPLDFRLIEVS